MISRNTNVIDAAERELKTTNDPARKAALEEALAGWRTSHTAAAFDNVFNVLHNRAGA